MTAGFLSRLLTTNLLLTYRINIHIIESSKGNIHQKIECPSDIILQINGFSTTLSSVTVLLKQ